MSLIEITEKYYETFSNKDINNLEGMFADDVKLTDWEIKAVGLKEVIKVIKSIFKNVETILIIPLDVYNDGNTVVSELEIRINNGQEVLSVVDIIEFDNDSKISAIRAYKR